jgi:SAM-dependent methyltransferase
MDATPTLCPWLRTPLGAAILSRERHFLHAPLMAEYGKRVAQLGCTNDDLLTASSMPHHIQISTDAANASDRADLYASPQRLPLDQDSIDCLVLHHALETASDPHGVLREAARTLAGEGLLLILGFNRYSYWSAWRLLGMNHPPRGIPLFSLYRLCDWLKLLDLQVEKVDTFFSLPPIAKTEILERLKILHELDRVPLRALHALYLVQARKHIAPLTPTRLHWQTDTRLLAGGVMEPLANSESATPALYASPHPNPLPPGEGEQKARHKESLDEKWQQTWNQK